MSHFFLLVLRTSQFLIVENSKRINFGRGCVTNVFFWELGSNFGIFKQVSENSPQHLWFKRFCNKNFFKKIKN